MALVTLRSYRDPIAAEIARAALESAGIPAFIRDEHVVRMDWLYSAAIGGVKVDVDDSDLERAREVLSRDHSADLEEIEENHGPPASRERCPACGSPFVKPSRLYRVAAAISLLISIPIPVGRHRMVCNACGHAWTQHPDASAEVPRVTLEAERAVYERRSHPQLAVMSAAVGILIGLWLVQRAC